MTALRVLTQLVLMLLPWTLRRRALALFLGFSIAPSARVGFSLLLCRRVRIAAGCRLGSLTLVKGIEELTMEEGSRLGSLNWVTGLPLANKSFFYDQPDRYPALILGRSASITSRHYIDCTDRVTLGEFTVFGGWQSQLLTHSIDVAEARQRAAPVEIGRYCFIGTRVIFLKGAVLPDRCVVAAGSVYGRRDSEPLGLYSGVPAARVRELDAEHRFFHRQLGHRD
jgi:hypothetical protein